MVLFVASGELWNVNPPFVAASDLEVDECLQCLWILHGACAVEKADRQKKKKSKREKEVGKETASFFYIQALLDTTFVKIKI